MNHHATRRRGLRAMLVAAIVLCAGTLAWMLRPVQSPPELQTRASAVLTTPAAASVPEPVASTVSSGATPAALSDGQARAGRGPSSDDHSAESATAILTQDAVVASAGAPNAAGGGATIPRTHQEEVEARLKLAVGDDDAQRVILGRAIIDERIPEAWRRLQWEKLQTLNDARVFSRRNAAGFRQLTVRKGESLWAIAQRAKRTTGVAVAHGLLATINGVPATGLQPGDRVKVPEHAFEVLVDKSAFRLYLLLDGAVVHHVAVGIGREDRTPEGVFTISSRIVHPDWTDPKTGKTIPFGAPGHLIGSRWLGFSADGRKTGFGIHGTVDPESIGKALSDGCVRLAELDLTRVFEWIPEGALVRIRP